MGTQPGGKGFTNKDLLDAAKEKYNVFHLNVMDTGSGKYALPYWERLLGQNCIRVDDHTNVPSIIVDIVLKHSKSNVLLNDSVSVEPTTVTKPVSSKEDIIL